MAYSTRLANRLLVLVVRETPRCKRLPVCIQMLGHAAPAELVACLLVYRTLAACSFFVLLVCFSSAFFARYEILNTVADHSASLALPFPAPSLSIC